jgi:hypothetical protein
MDGAKVRDLYLTAEAWQTSASRVAYRFFRSLGDCDGMCADA